ncbi:hypothetical protein C0992_010750, partial [Termitomyces sp. T32_za158]
VVGIIAINWLVIADQSGQGIFDGRCMTLSNLHSDAVDYPKSGKPVSVSSIPKLPRVRPDWNAPETVDLDSARYYQSQRAIGRLFRDITLPANLNLSRRSRRQRLNERTMDELSSAMDDSLSMTDDVDEVVQTAIRDRIDEFIDTSRQLPAETVEQAKGLFQRYVSGLTSICNTYSLSYYRPLTEEEAVVGTIVQKTSQPRLRQDMTAKLREQTDILVRGIREELAGDDDDEEPEEYLQRAWASWKLSILERSSFGGESFGWIGIGAVFDAIKVIEEIRLEEMRSRFY